MSRKTTIIVLFSFLFLLIYWVIGNFLLYPHFIPDECYYHIHPTNATIEILFDFPAVNGFHPVPTRWGYLLFGCTGAIIGWIWTRRKKALPLSGKNTPIMLLLALLTLFSSCSEQSGNSIQLSEEKALPAAEDNFPAIIEIDCDSIYPNQQLKLRLESLDEKSQEESDNTCIFIVTKNQHEIFRDTLHSSSHVVQFKAFNKDGTKDILVQYSSDARSNWSYSLFLVDSKLKKFNKIKSFEQIKNPNFLPKYDLIDCEVMSGRNWTSFYKIQGDSIHEYGYVLYRVNEDGKSLDFDKNYMETIQKIIKAESKSKWKKYFFPNMHYCGGAVYGFYEGSELKKIEATYGAELGYSERIVEFKNKQISTITYRKHFAEWDVYREKYPDEEEFDEKKMTYTNEVFVFSMSPKLKAKHYVDNKLVSTAIPTELLNELIECTWSMKKSLESEKELEK